MLPDIGLAKGACTLWEEELLLDYTIEVGDEQFKVHKVVMASVSDYFKAMLTGGMLESQEDRVRLEGLRSLAVRNVIEFVYTGQFGSTKASAEERLTCATYLQIPSAIIACTASLCEEVNKENCLHLLSIFKACSNTDGIKCAGRFVKENIDSIIDDCKPQEIPYDEFVGFMDFWNRSEWDLFVIAKQWLQADYGRRKDHINDIMTCIRFCLLSPTELCYIRDVYLFSDSDKQWQDLVEKALQYHDLPTHQKVLDESEQAKIRVDPTPVCFSLNPNTPGRMYRLYKEKSWVDQNLINPPNMSEVLRIPSVEINNFVIVSDYSDAHEAKFFMFDPRTLTWSAMASMAIPKAECTLVNHENHLYAIGGIIRTGDEDKYTDVIEKYDFQNDLWSISSSKLPVALWRCHAVSVAGCIYILGHWKTDEQDTIFTDSLESFDPNSNKWEEKAAPPNVCSDVVVLELDGEAVLAVSNWGSKLHSYKPSTNQWSVFATHSKQHMNFFADSRLLASGNVLYLLNFMRESRAGRSNYTRRWCEKWTFGQTGRDIVRIDTFPLDTGCNFCVLISLTLQSMKGK